MDPSCQRYKHQNYRNYKILGPIRVKSTHSGRLRLLFDREEYETDRGGLVLSELLPVEVEVTVPVEVRE